MVRRPHTRGALVAVWNAGEILIVKNSYRAQYTLPGGYIRPGESPVEAGARELAEEVDIQAQSGELREVYTGIRPFEHRRDEVTIVELDLDERPALAVDRREVVWAGFESPLRVLALPTVPHVGEYLRLVVDRESPRG